MKSLLEFISSQNHDYFNPHRLMEVHILLQMPDYPALRMKLATKRPSQTWQRRDREKGRVREREEVALEYICVYICMCICIYIYIYIYISWKNDAVVFCIRVSLPRERAHSESSRAREG